MKLSVFYHHVKQAAAETGRTMDETLKWLGELGIEAVEADYMELVKDGDMLEPLLEKHGLGVSGIYAFFNFASQKAENFDVYRMAKRFGCRTVMPIPGRYSEDESRRAAEWESMMDGMRAMAACGREYGIRTVMENFDTPRCPFAQVENLLRLYAEAPEVYCTFDIGNFLPARQDALEAYDALRGKIRHVHLKDHVLTPWEGAAPSQPLPDGPVVYSAPIGGGIMPVAQILARLKNDGYDGWITIEAFGVPSYRDVIEQSAAFVREKLNI